MFPVPLPVSAVLEQVKKSGFFVSSPDLTEEEQSISRNFEEETEIYPVEAEDVDPIEVDEPFGSNPSSGRITFFAFLDGIQRTMMLPYRVLLPNGVAVPIHIAQIAAGVMFRDPETGKLHVDPKLVASRLLLLGPFKGIKEAGGLKDIDFPEEIMDTSDRTFDVPRERNEWIVCDTTFCGTEKDREKRREDAIVGERLLNEGMIRSRARSRVAVLRQRLELAVLAEFRARYPEEGILVDGPLFFIDKWRAKATRVLGPKLKEDQESRFEEKLLANVVGLIKTHRLRPKNPEKVLQLNFKQRSPALRLMREVDIKVVGENFEERGSYAGAHLTWYTRLRSASHPPRGLTGLVRIDIHRATLGIGNADFLNPRNFSEYKPIIDGITRAVWAERWPAFSHLDPLRAAAQIYPIEQLEKTLKSMVYPKRFLQHLLLSTWKIS